MTAVVEFSVQHCRVLDGRGEVVAPLPEFARDPAALVAMYRAMVLTRTFDSRAVAMQRTGKLGTFASALGQEAVGVGVASAMRDEDVLVPSYREQAAQFMRGMTMAQCLLYWGGDERGSDFQGVARHDFPNCVPIGTQVPHAAGIAYAFKLRKEPRVAVTVFGDGGTSKGDFYEGMNMAGAWKVPLVLVINNNQWAISLPRARQTAAETLAQKAMAAGIDGLQVDGNDVIAVRKVVADAVERARRGDGPTVVEAVNLALAWEMAHDDSVMVLGEDVGLNGGVFRATVGLQQRFGPDRVLDTPLAESGIAGVAVGMAAMGLKPVAEIQFSGFIYPTLDHMVNHASRLRNRTRGRLTCPMVLRSPSGAGIHAPEHHSEANEAMFAHVPGLRVVMPSSPSRAYGLLLAAIRDPDPVVFLEPTRLYRLFRQSVEDNGAPLPLDACFTEREGTDVTLVSWGAMMHETLKAADALASQGVSADVIDVATLKPLDMSTILESVAKTGRCVVVHEAARTAGFGAEIAANIGGEALTSLLAPVQRVTGYDTIVPLARLEHQYLPSVERIVAAARTALEWA